MTNVWSHDNLIEFVKLYQAEPVIWDPKHHQHKDKTKVNDAWKRISNIMKIPIEDLKPKKNSILATFRGHLRKKKASLKSGAGENKIYKPIWFLYDQLESFMGGINDCATTIDSERGNSSQVDEDIRDEDESKVFPPVSPMNQSEADSLPPRPTLRRRARPPELIEAARQMKEACNTVNRIANKMDEEDECDYYAKILAKKLKRLPEEERELFMYEIDGMFIKRRNRLNNVANLPEYCPPSPSPASTSSRLSHTISSRRTQSECIGQTACRPTTSSLSYRNLHRLLIRTAYRHQKLILLLRMNRL